MNYVDTWKAMEKLVTKGLTKSIGLSNFNKGQIEKVLKDASIKPANLQVSHIHIKNFMSSIINEIRDHV